MTTIVVPPLEGSWPSLGWEVANWIEDSLVFGPGDLRGQPAELDAEKRALIHRMYEVFPREHPQAGRRRFKRCCLSLRKGSAKTELAAWLAAAELHPEAPVRFDGWDAAGDPVGRGVTDPYIPLVAYTEEQSDELAFRALYIILSEGPLAEDFDIGLERIDRKDGSGRCQALAAAPDSRDGARTTFQLFDETHRFVLPRLLESHQTMMANLPKRKIADAWALEVTTSFIPGEGSVAENTWQYAHAILDGKHEDPRLFFFHRQAGDGHDLTSPAGVRDAIVEASGPVAEWSDIDAIAGQWEDPTTDKGYLERVWLNRPRQSSGQAFNVDRWRELAVPDYVVPDRSMIVLGFDGSMFNDATALVGIEIATGHVWPIQVWEKPLHGAGDWAVPRLEVNTVVDETFSRYRVWRMYADPAYWESNIAEWEGRYSRGSSKRVALFDTRRRLATAYACREFAAAITTGVLRHGGELVLERHIGHAHKEPINQVDPETGEPLWTIRKERSDSMMKIDAAMAAVIAWVAYSHAKGAGISGKSVYEDHGLESA